LKNAYAGISLLTPQVKGDRHALRSSYGIGALQIPHSMDAKVPFQDPDNLGKELSGQSTSYAL
jgi:hypothetical protein